MIPPFILGKLLHNFLGGPVTHKSCEKLVLLLDLVLVHISTFTFTPPTSYSQHRDTSPHFYRFLHHPGHTSPSPFRDLHRRASVATDLCDYVCALRSLFSLQVLTSMDTPYHRLMKTGIFYDTSGAET